MAFRGLHDSIAVGMICLAVGIVVLGKADTSRAADLPNVGFQTAPEEASVTIAGKPVATYLYADKKTQRPYFAHVKSPGGIQVTRNHPPVAGKDRDDHDTMHPGIWMAFGDLDGEDFWRNKGRVVHEKFVTEPTGGPGEGTFAVRNRYERADGELVAYSDLAVLPDGTILCFYENGIDQPTVKRKRDWAYANLTLAGFHLDWITTP